MAVSISNPGNKKSLKRDPKYFFSMRQHYLKEEKNKKPMLSHFVILFQIVKIKFFSEKKLKKN